MKKEIFIIVFIILLIVIFHIVTQKNTESFFESISDDLSDLEDTVLSENFEKDELVKDINELQDRWKSKYDFFACFIEHD